ncbi:hypothetical protein [Bacillus massiliglaciei]|uniref:hypothetical protein n=1 Tax=Bacillus massiliglaciei TaxID=1816693 RepID=UPI000DA62F3D|nr:hypothetical protein [Bacillus massiliglaciei]
MAEFVLDVLAAVFDGLADLLDFWKRRPNTKKIDRHLDWLKQKGWFKQLYEDGACTRKSGDNSIPLSRDEIPEDPARLLFPQRKE